MCLGGGIGYFSGLLNTNLNWRWTFRILGILGLAVVPFSMIILYEPRAIRESRKQRQQGKSSYSIVVSNIRIKCSQAFVWLTFLTS